jgi:hypothetical protein
MRVAIGVLILTLAVAEMSAIGDDEAAVANAVLRSYFAESHGVGSHHHVLLYYRSVSPARDQLEVRVFSPANDEAAAQYGSPDVKRLIKDLRARSARIAIVSPPFHEFSKTSMRAIDCIDQPKDLTNVLAVSRPGFDGRNKALLYLEYFGGARAYHLVRKDSHWTVDWYVELWQCG